MGIHCGKFKFCRGEEILLCWLAQWYVVGFFRLVSQVIFLQSFIADGFFQLFSQISMPFLLQPLSMSNNSDLGVLRDDSSGNVLLVLLLMSSNELLYIE
jgi:hypothetical protein